VTTMDTINTAYGSHVHATAALGAPTAIPTGTPPSAPATPAPGAPITPPVPDPAPLTVASLQVRSS
jgi:hypothetical protein